MDQPDDLDPQVVAHIGHQADLRNHGVASLQVDEAEAKVVMARFAQFQYNHLVMKVADLVTEHDHEIAVVQISHWHQQVHNEAEFLILQFKILKQRKGKTIDNSWYKTLCHCFVFL